MPKASPPFPSLSPNGGGGGGGGGAGESGRRPPDLQGEVSPLSWSIPGEMSNPGGLFPDLRKSKNEATNPAFDSESFSSPYKDKEEQKESQTLTLNTTTTVKSIKLFSSAFCSIHTHSHPWNSHPVIKAFLVNTFTHHLAFLLVLVLTSGAVGAAGRSRTQTQGGGRAHRTI